MKKAKIAQCLLLMFFLSQNLFSQDLFNGLISVYEFEDTSTVVLDSYGTNSGTSSNITTSQHGKSGLCFLYNGTSSYTEMPNSSELNPSGQDYSLNVWIKWEGGALSSSMGGVVQKGEYKRDGSEMQLMLRGGGGADYKNGFYFRLRTPTVLNTIGCDVDQTANIGNGSWHMLTAVVDKGGNPEGKIYLDGTEVGSSTSLTVLTNNSADFYVGKYEAIFFDGKIDQLSIWNKALSQSEISQLYNSGNGLPYTEWDGGSELVGGTISPSSLTITSGSNPVAISNTVSASGGTGSYSYQWQQSTNSGSSWTTISSATNTSYTPGALTQTTWYRRQVISGTETAYSNTSQINVNIPSLSGGTISPSSLTIRSGESPGAISNTVSASGGTGSYSYQWQQSINSGASWSSISGANSSSYTPASLIQTTWYRRQVTSGTATAYSNTSQITVTTGSVTCLWNDHTSFINYMGKVGINTTDPGDYELAVNGKIHAKEVVVDLSGWADYVFDENYSLKSLADVENYILKNNHLPEMPSADEVESNGADLGKMNVLLLKKVEELTLYILQQEKRISELEKKAKNDTAQPTSVK